MGKRKTHDTNQIKWWIMVWRLHLDHPNLTAFVHPCTSWENFWPPTQNINLTLKIMVMLYLKHKSK